MIFIMQIAYKRLEIWRLAYDFVLEIYKVLETFPNFENDNIKYQLRRAATSLPLNIAEGSGASSPRLFLNYLTFAYRSSREIEALLMLSKDLKYLDDKEYDRVSNQLDFFMRKLYTTMKYWEKEYIKRGDKKDLSSFYKQQKANFSQAPSISK